MSQTSPSHPPPSALKERNKYQSPPPPPSSMTPPPSSRAPQLSYPQARTPTPTHSHLSSPPPTLKTPPHQPVLEPDSPSHPADDAAHASPEQLRLMLANATAEARAAKASAAHHRLQCELLSLEFSEAVKRFDVELEMAHKEVEVLQHSHAQSQVKLETPNAASLSRPDHTTLDLNNHIRLLEIDNESLRRRLADAKALILEREGLLSEENERLRHRIRENRQHFNHIRQSGGFFGDKSPASAYQAPYTASTQNPQLSSPSKPRQVEPFAALLLADQVLSQEAASSPATPIAKPSRRQQASHVRGLHSMSSLPSTPFRSTPAGSAARTTAPFYTQPGLASSPIQDTPPSRHLQRRRQSRDSTISASDNDERAPQQQDPDRVLDSEDEGRVTSPSLSDDAGLDVYTSQASQEAANMLRKSASFSRSQQTPTQRHNGKGSRSGISASPTARKGTGGTGKGSDMVQTKMYGYQITKPSISGQSETIKRRFYDHADESPRPSKKAKADLVEVDREAVGLGIGGWAGAGR